MRRMGVVAVGRWIIRKKRRVEIKKENKKGK
jgi:hypothetical protein